jgi:hypothetical protein
MNLTRSSGKSGFSGRVSRYGKLGGFKELTVPIQYLGNAAAADSGTIAIRLSSRNQGHVPIQPPLLNPRATPRFPDRLDFFLETELARIAVTLADELQHCKHVIRNLIIDIPQIGGVPAAVLGGIMPTEQEIGDAAGLAGISRCYRNQPPQCSLRSLFVHIHNCILP